MKSKKPKGIWNEFSKDEKIRIEARYKKLRQEYLTLRDLRKARLLTQERMAEMLHIRQENVSRIEKRSDLLLSTLRSYVAAMGGDVKLIVEFPDRMPVTLEGLGEPDHHP